MKDLDDLHQRPYIRLFNRLSKRSFDILFSLIGLVILSPVFGIIAIMIQLDSRRPVFYRQVRVGQHRRDFRLIKFRTMIQGADRHGQLVTASGDQRVTRIGRFLRCTKLDELPELWNVLIGDMSLVGPRPEVPKYIEYYRPEWNEVFSVRPGITDLATLQFRNEEIILGNVEDSEDTYINVIIPAKLRLSLEGLQRQSVGFYFKILIFTVWSLIFRQLPAISNRGSIDGQEFQTVEHK